MINAKTMTDVWACTKSAIKEFFNNVIGRFVGCFRKASNTNKNFPSNPKKPILKLPKSESESESESVSKKVLFLDRNREKPLKKIIEKKQKKILVPALSTI